MKKRLLPEFFYYTRAERLGILALVVLCLAFAALPSGLRWWLAPEPPDFGAYVAELAQLHTRDSDTTVLAVATDLGPPTAFDPNTATRDQLESLGLPASTVRAWLSYLAKGGQFRSAADLARFRALSAVDLARIQPYLLDPGGNSPAAGRPAGRTDRPELDDDFPVAELFDFDPNTATEAELRRLGLPMRTVRSLLNYRDKGGRFRQPADLAKLYTLSEADFQRLAPYVQIKADEGSATHQARVWPARTPATIEPIDINQATAEQWQQLPGIGPAYSRRIVNFRDKLGGFHRIEQVAETYGLPDSTFQKISPYLRTSAVEGHLAINSADAATLALHPYVDRRSAEAIVSYRQQHGPFAGPEALRRLHALPPGLVDKLAPYLRFD